LALSHAVPAGIRESDMISAVPVNTLYKSKMNGSRISSRVSSAVEKPLKAGALFQMLQMAKLQMISSYKIKQISNAVSGTVQKA
jgi:hypothetical protein